MNGWRARIGNMTAIGASDGTRQRLAIASSVRAWWRQHQSAWFWGGVSLSFCLLTVWLMRNWLGAVLLGEGVPSSHRREMFTELTLAWLFKQELASGHLLSEWNPIWFSGFPWLRFLSYPLYYPLAALSTWTGVPLPTVMVLFYFVAMAGSGLTMFAYLYHVLGDWRAALFGAIAYETFPYHSHVGVETWIHAAFWVLLPLPLLFIERALADERHRTHYLLLTGITLGLFPLVSSEYALIAGLFAVLYILFRIGMLVRAGQVRIFVAFWHLALVGGTALGLAACMVIPALFETRYVGIHVKHGAETTFTNQLLRDYSVTPRLIWYAIARRLHFAVSPDGLPGLRYSFWSVTWYPGLIVLLLAGLGIPSVRQRFAARAALVGLLLALLLITGPTFALNPFTHLPILGRLSPFRGMMLVIAFLCVLAGYGMHGVLGGCRRLLQHSPQAFGPSPILSNLLHRALGSAKARWLPWISWALAVALLLFDFQGSAQAYQTMEATFTPDERRAYAWLASHADQGRLLEPAEEPRDQYLRAYSLTELSIPRYAGYYDNGAPLYTWQQNAWTDLKTILHLHRVRYVLLRDGEPRTAEYEQQLGSFGYWPVFRTGNVRIWENPQVSGYVLFYERAALDMAQSFFRSFEALPELVWRGIAMVSADTLPARELSNSTLASYDYLLIDDGTVGVYGDLLTSHQAKVLTVSELGSLEPSLGTEAVAWSTRSSYGTIHLEANVAQRGLLVLSESWYPHWQATVDGRPATVLRVNWALMGLWLEPGKHEIVFQIRRPWYVTISYLITLGVALTLAGWWTWRLVRLLDHRPEIPMLETSDGWQGLTEQWSIGGGESRFDRT